jgi:hypothetical protein
MDETLQAWLNDRAKKRNKGKAGRKPGELVKMGTWRTAYMQTVPEDDPVWLQHLDNDDIQALLASSPARIAPVAGAVEDYDGELRPELYNDKYDELEGYHEAPHEEVEEYITTDHNRLMRDIFPLQRDSDDDQETPNDDIDWGSSDDEGSLPDEDGEPSDNGGANDGTEFQQTEQAGDKEVPVFSASAGANWGWCRRRRHTKFRKRCL